MPWHCATWTRHDGPAMNQPVVDALSRPAVARGFRLQWEAAQNAHGRNIEALRWRDDDCGHHDGSRTRLRDFQSVRGCPSLRRLRRGEEMAANPFVNAPARPGPPLWLLL